MTWPLQMLKNTCESKTVKGRKNLSATVSTTSGTQICEVETSWCKTFCPPLRNVVMWLLQSSNIGARWRHRWARRARHSRSQRIGSSLHSIFSNLFCVRHPRTGTSRRSHFGLEAQRASGENIVVLIWKITKSVFRVPHEIVLSAAVSAWLQNVPELSLLTLVSFHCLLRPAEARQLRWCDVEILVNTLRKIWHRPHQRTQNAQDDRSCNSATRAFGMSWNLSTGQNHEILNS